MKRRRAAALVAIATAAIGAHAAAQRVDPRRPKTLVVGPPRGASPMHRVDARRSGVSAEPLPAGTLRVAWKKAFGTFEQAALAAADGTLVLVTTRGDVSFVDDAGEERASVRAGAVQAGPAALTADGTVVYATSVGTVMGLRRSAPLPRFTTRIGGERGDRRAAPLPLDDGGIVVATANDLVLLDAEGNVRSRSTVPETIAAPLLAAGERVLAIGASGTVFAWTPGREAARIGSFDAPVDGGAAVDGTGLVAVIEGNHLARVDLARGGRSTIAIGNQGLYLGPPSVRAGLVTVQSLTHTKGFIVTLDASGQELLRAPLATFTPAVLPDGGVPALVAPAHVGPVVDARGAIAFAATDGTVGVVGADGSVDVLGDPPCGRSGPRAGVVGLTPAGANAFVVTCDNGTVARIDSRPH